MIMHCVLTMNVVLIAIQCFAIATQTDGLPNRRRAYKSFSKHNLLFLIRK